MPKVLRILSRLMVGGPVQQAVILSKDLAPEYETLLVGGPPEAGEEGVLDDIVRAGVRVELMPSMRRAPGPLRDLVSLVQMYRASCRPITSD